MIPTYRIKHWETHFENAESRKYKKIHWVPVPNQHDGKGYRRVISSPQGAEIFAAWILLLQVASRVKNRGLLVDDDGPISSADLSFKTGLPECVFLNAFNVLSSKEIGWLEVVSPGESGKSPETPGELPVEQNRIEQNRISTHTQPAGNSQIPKTETEAIEWASMKAVPAELAKRVYLQCEARGWVEGSGRQIVSWASYIQHRHMQERGDTTQRQMATDSKSIGRPTGPSGADKVAFNNELSRVDKEIEILRQNYSGHQTWDDADKLRMKGLKDRRKELMTILNVKY